MELKWAVVEFYNYLEHFVGKCIQVPKGQDGVVPTGAWSRTFAILAPPLLPGYFPAV